MTLLALLAPAFADTPATPGEPAPDAKWHVDDAHGATHPVSLDLHEGTWMSVTVHGDRVVFDLLGDLWSIPLAGGEATHLTSGAAWDCDPRFSPDGKQIAFASDRGGNENLWIMDADGKNARQFTFETDARVTDPVWDPDGPWILGRRRTVDTRSIGVTELWQYHLEGGKGFRLTSLDQHPHAGEATTDGRYIWFSSRAGRFEYNADPLAGLWAVDRLDRRTGEILPQVGGSGSAARPMISPDGKTLVFISRIRGETILEALDLASGRRHTVMRDLDRDEMEAFALHGVYPAMDWTPDGAIVLWAKGKLWRVTMDGQKAEIPFHAQGTWPFRDVDHWQREIHDTVRARVLRWPTWGPDGSVVFSAMGALWQQAPNGEPVRLSPGTGYAPAFSPDGKQLAWTSWSDSAGGQLHITTLGKKRTDEVLPIAGQLVNPAWSADGKELVVLRGVGGVTSPDLVAEMYYEIVHLVRGPKGSWTSSVVTSTGNRGSGTRATRLWLHENRVWFLEDRPGEPRKPSDTALVSVALDGTDKRTALLFHGAEEVAISPDFTRVAYKMHHEAYITALPEWGGGEVEVGDAVPINQLTDVVGDWVDWTPDGKEVTWAMGPTLSRKAVTGVGATRPDPDAKEPPKPDYAKGVTQVEVNLTVPRARPTGTVALTHARVLTMKGDEILTDVTVLVERDRITKVDRDVAIPQGAQVIDCTGKTVIPGMIDVHAHLHYTAGDVLPEQEWRYLTSLDFGVTTVHDPSAATDLVFTQSERVEAGFEKGPRVYSTGGVLYGALANDAADTPDPDAALRHVKRMESAGAFSVKVYQQGQRERRQWFVQACNEEHVLCVPEGGGDLFQNLNMIEDGFHSVEHALPNAPLYQDVVGWFAGSHTATTPGTAWTPTLLVAYGGLFGENWFYQNMNPLNDQRLLRHFPARELDATAWRRGVLAQDTSWNFQQVAREAARMYRAGVPVTLGAHGQLQGLGAHWELWGLAGPGAMTPMEALHAATIDGAIHLGLDRSLGTIEAGKLADLVVLDADPLADIHNSEKIALVMKNGEIYR